ncbi:hypothetical protein J0S82_020889, partial [Galemys pyrenaicus]
MQNVTVYGKEGEDNTEIYANDPMRCYLMATEKMEKYTGGIYPKHSEKTSNNVISMTG